VFCIDQLRSVSWLAGRWPIDRLLHMYLSLIETLHLYWCVAVAGAAESDYGIDSEIISCDSVFDDSQQESSDADVNSYSPGKIAFVQCSAGPVKSDPDVSLDVMHGTLCYISQLLKICCKF